MKLLLDTYTFLWWIRGGSEITGRVVDVVRAAENEVYLSAASAWEIALKHGRGRLRLSEPPERYVPAQREAHHITSLPVDEESALHVLRLPDLHRDPFDRMLVAQAIVHGLTIVTPDPLVLQYPARTMW